MKRIPALLLAFAWLLLCIPASAEGNIMKFDTTVGRVFEGETLQTVLIREGAPAEGEVTYEASNRKVAEVDSRGVVTGLNKGQTTITASVKTEKKTFRAQLTDTGRQLDRFGKGDVPVRIEMILAVFVKTPAVDQPEADGLYHGVGKPVGLPHIGETRPRRERCGSKET